VSQVDGLLEAPLEPVAGEGLAGFDPVLAPWSLTFWRVKLSGA
jgi:hypothetical protein